MLERAATPATIDDSLLPFSLPSFARKKFVATFDGGRICSVGGVMLLGFDNPRSHLLPAVESDCDRAGGAGLTDRRLLYRGKHQLRERVWPRRDNQGGVP
jgi:hypothetical protein